MIVDITGTKEKGRVYTLCERNGLTVYWKRLHVYVPQGFETDGASVPRFFWRLVFPPGDERALRAAFAHDYVYRIQPSEWTRKEADSMFFTLLKQDGIPRFSAWLAYLGVRLFGGIAWRKNRKEKVS